MKQITAEELSKRYGMEPHVENGAFIETHYKTPEAGRPASGSMYYYVAPEEITKFHSIDCDEYWCYAAGSPLELCSIGKDGEVIFLMLGVEEGCEPVVFLRCGTIFASRHLKGERNGTFLSCITVPRFDPRGFTLFENEEMLEKYPQLEKFFATDA